MKILGRKRNPRIRLATTPSPTGFLPFPPLDKGLMREQNRQKYLKATCARDQLKCDFSAIHINIASRLSCLFRIKCVQESESISIRFFSFRYCVDKMRGRGVYLKKRKGRVGALNARR